MRWALLALAGCMPVGSAHLQDSPQAPWPLDEAEAVLWSVPSTSTWRDGVAVLVVSDGRHDCDEVGEATSAGDLLEVLADETGLIFVLTRSYWDQVPYGEEWEGTYLGGKAYDLWSLSEMGLTTVAFHDGLFTRLSEVGEAATWVRVDFVGWESVRGEFFASWWRGRFRAELCSEGTEWDTGWWDTGWWDQGK